MTDAQVIYRPNAPGVIEALSLSEDPVRLRRAAGTRSWWLSVKQRYTLVETDDPARGPWKVSTRAYRYRIDDNDGEVASWHWHPSSRGAVRDPHLHISHGPLAKTHLPTRRVGFEAVLRLLLVDLGAHARRAGWQDVLDGVEDAFDE